MAERGRYANCVHLELRCFFLFSELAVVMWSAYVQNLHTRASLYVLLTCAVSDCIIASALWNEAPLL